MAVARTCRRCRDTRDVARAPSEQAVSDDTCRAEAGERVEPTTGYAKRTEPEDRALLEKANFSLARHLNPAVSIGEATPA